MMVLVDHGMKGPCLFHASFLECKNFQALPDRMPPS